MISVKRIFTFICVLFATSSAEKLIIDTDAGGDDAAAILLILAAEALGGSAKFEVVAVTCTYGNTIEENVETNVRKTLTIANRSDIPIYAGSKRPLLHNFTTDNYFGNDGFGDFKFNLPINVKLDKSRHAAMAIIDLVLKYSGNISIITLGPLTNLAVAMILNPSLGRHLNNIYVMGGSVAGRGNIRPNVEFNFAADPESNFIVLNSTETPKIILVPWDLKMEPIIPMKWRRTILGKADSRYITFLNNVERLSMARNSSQWFSPDLIMAAVMLNSSLKKERLICNVEAVIDGRARGSLLVDYNKSKFLKTNVEIVLALDTVKFRQIVTQYLTK